MPQNSVDHHHDSPHMVALLHTPIPRRQYRLLWRKIFIILHIHEIFTSIANNAKKGSRALPLLSSSSPTSYAVLHAREEINVTRTSPTRSHIALDVHPCTDCDVQPRQELARIVRNKDIDSLHAFGGVQGIAFALGTHLENGLQHNAGDLRHQHIPNTYWNSPAPAHSLFYFVFEACNNCTIMLLFLAAALSLGFGIKEEGFKNGWYDGVTIILAIFVLVALPSVRNLYREVKLQRLSKRNKIVVDVMRDGRPQKISISDVAVGDIACLKKDDWIPADGLFFGSQPLQTDDVLDSRVDGDKNPFVFSGTKVIEGCGRMLVTSVGKNTELGEMMASITRNPDEKTPLEAQLDKMNSYTQNIALLIAILILVVLFLRYKLGYKDDETGCPELNGKITPLRELIITVERILIKPRGKVSVLTSTLTMLLVGIREQLPFAIVLSISYWNGKLMSDQVIVQELSGCVTMGSVTTICTDKIGGLRAPQIEVDVFLIGKKAISEEYDEIDSVLLEALRDGVGTAILMPQAPCSPTDQLLVSWAELKLGMNVEVLKQSCTVLETKPLNSNQKRSGVLMRKSIDNGEKMPLHWNGDAATILAMCSHYYDSKGVIKAMDEQKKEFTLMIEDMRPKCLKSIAFAYKQIDLQKLEEDGLIDLPKLEEDELILLGIVGFKDPWAETRKDVEACRNAGVDIKLISGDNVSVARAMAIECGILKPDSVVLEGKIFRNLCEEEMMKRVDHITVMGNSLPSDKRLLVQCLRKKGHVVAVVGVMTSESPALKEADIGLAMGTESTELARASSGIVILSSSFCLLATILKLGRCTYDNIQKFIQLELTMTIAGLLITSVTTLFMGEAPITPIQCIWVNLIVSILGGFAILTEPSTEELMEKQPILQTEPLVTKIMWRNIITQALYQAGILLAFQFKGQVIPGMNQMVSKAMIFNSFVLCQVFNHFNARELKKKNVFHGIHQNHRLLVALGASVVLQVVVVQFAKSLAGSVRLNWKQWVVCFLISMVSWAFGCAIKCISGFS